MKKNINTPAFWDYQNVKNERLLSKSEIYIQKHKLILSWLSTKRGKLLDIGIGRGYLEKHVLIKNKLIKLFGIDISRLSIKRIKEEIKGVFKVANVTKIPFKDGFFDFVTALDVLEHLNKNELDRGVSEIYRILKSRGTLILSVPLNESYKDKKTNRHLISFSTESMLGTLKRNGFDVINLQELFAFNRFYWLKTIIAKILKIRKPNLLVIKAIKSEL